MVYVGEGVLCNHLRSGTFLSVPLRPPLHSIYGSSTTNRHMENTVKYQTAEVTRSIPQTQLYDMDVVYRPGPSNANADCLSQIPIPTKTYQPPDDTTALICFILEDLAAEQAKDTSCTTTREIYNQRITESAVKEIQ